MFIVLVIFPTVWWGRCNLINSRTCCLSVFSHTSSPSLEVSLFVRVNQQQESSTSPPPSTTTPPPPRCPVLSPPRRFLCRPPLPCPLVLFSHFTNLLISLPCSRRVLIRVFNIQNIPGRERSRQTKKTNWNKTIDTDRLDDKCFVATNLVPCSQFFHQLATRLVWSD